MTTDNRNEDPDRAMEAFTAPLEIPEPIETPTLSTRLRAAADDIAFQGRPDPHDDKALLRDAARELETSAKRTAQFADRAERHSLESAHLFNLLFQIAALDPDDTQMSKTEFRGRVRNLADRRLQALAAGEIAGHVQALVLQPLGDCLNKLMSDPELDLECFPVKPDGSRQLEGEGGVEMAVRLLKLAAERGAFIKAPQILPSLPALSGYLRQVGRMMATEDPAEGASVMHWADVVTDVHALTVYLVDAHRPGAVDDASVCAVGEDGLTPPDRALQLLKLAMSRGAFAPGEHIRTEQGPMLLMQGGAGASLASWIVNSIGFEMRLWTADNGGGFTLVNPEALTDCVRRAIDTAPFKRDEPPQAASLCTGDVAPGAEAVDTRFVELFYLSGPRVGLRFEGMPDIYIPDADAHAIVKTLLSGGEHSAPSWKVISRAAEYFGQRVHVDTGTHKLVLTDSRTYFERTPVEMTPAEMLRGALELAAPGDYADPSPKGEARRALQRLGPTVAGMGGTVKLGAAVSIGPACGLSIDEFRPLLAAWNQVGSPRWSDEDLERRLVDRYAQTDDEPTPA